ncbi:MAG TPA: hypothetical protein VIJ28_20885 [Chloroflexota bacterium]
MALLPGSPEAVRADSLIDQLAEYGITYITGGQGAGNHLDTNSRPHANNPAAVRLFAELSDAPAVRVADAMVALLLRHPELAPQAREVLNSLEPWHPQYRLFLARFLAAAALQRIWRFVLDIYRGSQAIIDVADLCRMLDLPNAEQDHGEALLAAVSRWLDPTETTDWAGGWENAAAQLLSDLRFEPAHAG